MRLFFRLPFSINDVKYAWNINGDKVTQNLECNHEEADTRMVLHALLSYENVVAVATGTDVLLLMVLRIQISWLSKDGFLDTRMTNALIQKKFYCILVNNMPWHYWFILSLWHPHGFIFEISSWKVDSSTQVFYVQDTLLWRFEVWYNLICVNALTNFWVFHFVWNKYIINELPFLTY